MNELVNKKVTVNLNNGCCYYGILKDATETEITLYTERYGITIVKRSFIACISENGGN